jgi:hypothetical protein
VAKHWKDNEAEALATGEQWGDDEGREGRRRKKRVPPPAII